jgi:hypothetical protein
MFTRIGGAWSAAVSILLGMLVWGAGRFLLEWEAPYLIALACSGLAYIAVAAVSPRDQGVSPGGEVRLGTHPGAGSD